MNGSIARTTASRIEGELEVVDYVAGRLAPAELRAFEERLAADPALRRRVAQERELAGAVRGAWPRRQPPAAAIEALRPRLGGSRSRRAAWPFAAGAAAVLAAVAVATLVPGPEPTYEALSSEPAQRLDAAGRYRIVFAPGTDAPERDDAGARLGFVVVDGPGPGGSFVVATTRTVTREELRRWRGDDAILLAEPIHYGEAP